MPRTRTARQVDDLELAATRELLQMLQEASGLSAKDLEAELGFGSDGTETERSGHQLHRYLRGGSQSRRNARAMSPIKRDQLIEAAKARKIQVRPVIKFTSTLRALGRHSSGLMFSAATGSRSEVPASEWRSDYLARKATQRRERRQLKTIQAGAQKQLTRLLCFLQSVDGRGHDGWHVVPSASSADLPASPAEQNDRLIQQLEELLQAINGLHLGISESWSADSILEHRGMYPLLV
jgi:hypothetical protein